MRSGFTFVFLFAVSSLLWLGCTPSPESTEEPDNVWTLVVLGDSSLWELGKALEAQIESDVGVEVRLEDFALPALSAGQVLEVLHTGSSDNLRLLDLSAALKEADMVVMFVNPMQSIDPQLPLDLDVCFESGLPESCGPETLERWISDLIAIWDEIIQLREGQPTILRATDLYNPLVVPWQEAGVFEACTKCWENLSDAARSAAEARSIPFLSRLNAFNGPAHDEDPRIKGFIISDGEHPSELAARYTAELLSQMDYEPLHAEE